MADEPTTDDGFKLAWEAYWKHYTYTAPECQPLPKVVGEMMYHARDPEIADKDKRIAELEALLDEFGAFEEVELPLEDDEKDKRIVELNADFIRMREKADSRGDYSQKLLRENDELKKRIAELGTEIRTHKLNIGKLLGAECGKPNTG